MKKYHLILETSHGHSGAIVETVDEVLTLIRKALEHGLITGFRYYPV